VFSGRCGLSFESFYISCLTRPLWIPTARQPWIVVYYWNIYGISEVHTTSARDAREVIHLHSCPNLTQLIIHPHPTFFNVPYQTSIYITLGIHSVCQASIHHSLLSLHQHHIQQSQCPLDSTNFNQRPHMALVLPHHIGHTDHSHRQHQTTHNEHPPPPTPRAHRRLHTHPLPTHTTLKPATLWINNNPESSPSAAQDAQNA